MYWDGVSWTPIYPGFGGSVMKAFVREDRLYVGGNFSHAGGMEIPYLVAWVDDGVVEVEEKSMGSFKSMFR